MSDENYDYTPKPGRGRKAKPAPAAPAPRKREAAEVTDDYTPRPARRERADRAAGAPAPRKREAAEVTDYSPRPARRERADRAAGAPAKTTRPARKKGPASRPAKKIKLSSLLRSRTFMVVAGIAGLLILVVLPVVAELTRGGSASLPGSPVDLGNQAYDQALQRWDAGDYSGALTFLQQAASYYEQALTETPADTQVRTDLGAVYFYQSRLLSDTVLLQQAIQTWNVALQYEPDKPETLFNLGLGYADLGQVDQAIAMWQRVIQVAPGTPSAQSAAQLIQEYSGVIGP